MLFLLWLLLLGAIAYFMLQRGVSRITRTPVWILWLVMMAPGLIWGSWILIHRSRQPLPPSLAIAPLVICPCLYWLLILWGRRRDEEQESEGAGERGSAEAQEMGKKSLPLSQSPSSLRPIDKAEEANLRDCFPWSVYYLQNLEFRPQAVICRGHLRTNSEAAYQTISENVERCFGDRFLVMFQNSLSGQPFFALVPNPIRTNTQNPGSNERLTRPILALSLLAITLFTTTVAGAQIAGVTEKALQSDSSVLLKGLPYAIALIIILALHESAHYLTARFYKIRSSLPYFIPLPFFIGTFGAFIQMQTPIPNRKALFDISIAGPIVGAVISLPFLIWGLANSTVVPMSNQSGMLNFDSFNPDFSLLLALLSKLTLGSALTPETAINLHPVAVAGYIGLVVTAFNLTPVGYLDGGHIVHAMFGQRTSMTIGQIARFLMFLLGWLEQGFLLWAMLLFLMPLNDEPTLNDVSELDNWRDFWGLVSLGLLLMILLPAPRGLTQLFG